MLKLIRQIGIPAMGVYTLQFDAIAPDVNYPDGFKVYVSTFGDSVVDFGMNPALIVNEAPQTFTTYSVDLSASDKTLLLIIEFAKIIFLFTSLTENNFSLYIFIICNRFN